MASLIRQRFPQLADELNKIFSILKGQNGFVGLDIVNENGHKIRIIIQDAENTINDKKRHFESLISASSNIIWRLLPEIVIPKPAPIEDPRRSALFSTIQPSINIGDGRKKGTLGLICIDNINNNIGILTAHHVISGNPFVIQPSEMFYNLFAIAQFVKHDPNGDAAFCKLIVPQLNDFFGKRKIINNIISFKPEFFDGNFSLQSVRYPILDEKLVKIGLTTGKREAIVKGIGLYLHDQSFIATRKTTWVEGFWLETVNSENREDIEISFSGDSGSIWYSETEKAGVGLLIAGDRNDAPPNQEFSIAQHLSDIMEALDIKIFT